MTNALPELTRRSILLLVAGAGLGLSPAGFNSDPVSGKLRFGPAMAHAEGGSGENEPDEPDEPDKPEDREDAENSGSGGGADTGDGSDRADGGTLTGGQTGVQPVTPASGPGRNQLRNVTVRYPDGWVELILNDQYQLIDNLNRQVILRPATVEDFSRMIALGS